MHFAVIALYLAQRVAMMRAQQESFQFQVILLEALLRIIAAKSNHFTSDAILTFKPQAGSGVSW